MFFIVVVIPYSFFVVIKYLPFNSKNCPVDVNQKAEKFFVIGGELGWFAFGRGFFELNFYNDFMLIKLANRFVIVSYSEEITIKDGIFYSSFSFKKDNLKYCITQCSKEAIEYLKMKISKV